MKLNNPMYYVLFLFGVLIFLGILEFPWHKIGVNPIKNKKVLELHYQEDLKLQQAIFPVFRDFKTQYLKENPLANTVFLAKDGWYFLSDAFKQVYSGSIGARCYAKNAATKALAYLKKYQSFCRRNNIAFYVLVIPNKHRVYKEYLPYTLAKGTARSSPIIQRLEKNKLVIWPYKQLQEQKKTHPTYHKTDSHWNCYGAYFGYQALVQEMQKEYPDITPIALTQYEIVREKSSHTDLTTMLQYQKTPEKTQIAMIAKKKQQAVIQHSTSKKVVYQNQNKTKNLLLFGDSFSWELLPYLTEHFKKTTYYTKPYLDTIKIQQEKPDIVVLQIVERNLDVLLQ